MTLKHKALAPAKINLFLHINGRRADGMHNLQTAFQFVDWYDELTFSQTADGRIYRADNAPDYGDGDLVLKAARLLQQASGVTVGAEISLIKNLPSGAGLGGGSSDAATTLVTLNRLWQSGFSRVELAELALELGADVPVFVYGKSAWAEGVGEKLTFIDFPVRYLLLLNPDVTVSTGEIFNAKELTRQTSSRKITALIDSSFKNDCLETVCGRYPAVKEALAWLEQYAAAHLTGTGACVYALFDSKDEALKVLAQLPDKWQGFVGKAANISPLNLKDMI